MGKRLEEDLEAIFAKLVQGRNRFIRRQIEAQKDLIFSAAEEVLAPRYAAMTDNN